MGGRFPPKPKGKQVPHDGLYILDQNGSNVTVWKEATYAHAQAKYHSVGRAFADNKRFVREKPSLEELKKEHPDLSADHLMAVLQQETVQFIKMTRSDVDDEGSLFALVGQVTSDEGLARVKSLKAYATIAAERNANGLMELVISEHTLMMHHTSPREAKYTATDRYMNIKQVPSQTDADYLEKFKLHRSNMKVLKCSFDPDEEEEALHFLMRMDPLRHGEFMRDAVNRERAEAGKGIPSSVQGVVEAARRFISMPKTSGQLSASLVYAGHSQSATNDQGMANGPRSTPSQTKWKCNNCKKPGHYARDCTEPDQRKAGARVMCAETEDGEESGSDEQFGYNFSMRVVSAFRTVQNNKRVFTIDSYATESFVFCEDMLENCTDDETIVYGIHGPAKVGRRGVLPGIGSAIVSPGGGVNGVSLSQLERRFKVSYAQGVSFTVTLGKGSVLVFKFDANTGCYSCVFTAAIAKMLKEIETRFNYKIMVNTVKERQARYTKREVSRAEAAREMMRRMYHPSDVGMIRTINSGVMTNCDVTGKDVMIATDIWGRDVASIMGKTKDKGPAEDRRMFVPVMERIEQTVYADIFHWRKVSFLLFIVKPLKLLLIQWLPKQDVKHTIIAVNTLGNLLAGRGFRVTEIIVDPGKELTSLNGKVRYRINTVDARTHVADAEVEIKTVKERMRCTEARLPYKLPRRAVRFLADGVVGAYNTTLRAGETVSPRELFTGIKFDYARDMKFEFGEYVHAHVPPPEMAKRGPQHRTVGSIALCSTGNDRGGWWFMSLRKKTFFNALRGTALPMPDVVIDVLNALHFQDEGVKETAMETEVAVAQEDDGSGADMVGMPTVREAQEPIVQGAMGTVTDNHVSLTQLVVDETDQEELVVASSSGPATLNGITRQEPERLLWADTAQEEELEPEPVEEEEEELQETFQEAAEEEASQDAAQEDEVQGEQQLLRRSPRIANKVAGDVQKQEHKVHVFRMKTAKALAQNTQGAKRVTRILRLTIKKAMAKNPDATVASIQKEFRQLIDKNVWTVMQKAKLTSSQLRSAIRSSMFLKEKFDAAGSFEKLKARLVAGGDGQDRTLFDNLSCPTVTQETVMTVLAIAAVERRKLMTIDITGAYLECDLTDEMEVIMKLDPVLTKILHQIDKSVVGMQDDKGVTYVKLNKALYGTVQAALLWYEKLSGVLLTNGFKANPYDACLFNKVVNGVQITVCFHVDDLLVTSTREELLHQLKEYLSSCFTNLTVNVGKQHSYLAMNIVESEDNISADMTAYTDKCTEGRVFGRPATSPARDDLFDEPEEAEALSGEAKASFHSSVAQLLYLCKRTRVEALCAVSHLASRVSKPTKDDEVKLYRVLNYLAHTRERKVVMKKGGEVNMEAYIDASFGAHADGRSRTGVALMMNGACVGAWSSKQKLNTKSSTEAEIVGLSDGLPHVLWMRELLLAQGHSMGPSRVHQDNQGVLSIMKEGRRPKHRTKHLNIRHFFARDRVKSGDISLTYCPTREMVADVLTKAVNGELFWHLVGML